MPFNHDAGSIHRVHVCGDFAISDMCHSRGWEPLLLLLPLPLLPLLLLLPPLLLPPLLLLRPGPPPPKGPPPPPGCAEMIVAAQSSRASATEIRAVAFMLLARPANKDGLSLSS